MKRFLVLLLIHLTSATYAQEFGVRNVAVIPYLLESATGVSRLETKVRNYYNNSKNNFPKKGELFELNDTFLLSMFNYSGEFCSLLVSQDMNKPYEQRRVFESIDFNIPPHNWNQAQKNNLFERLSEVFWQRNLTTEEGQIISQEFDGLLSVMPVHVSSGPSLTLPLCAVYASAPNFLLIGE
jgi:hypothetical protein